MLICASCGQENPDHARFCLGCGAPLSEAAAPRELRKTVSVVFCDVLGSTAIGERLDPEPLRRLLLRFYGEMKGVCEAHGGRVRELIGDAVMAAFGVPVVHEDDALRAVRAAVGMRERLEGSNEELEREFGVRLQSRTGVNTGEVVVREPDPSGALALGDAVNVAARLQSAAEPGEILLGETTYRLLEDAVRAEPVEPLSLKGKAKPVPAYRLVEVLAQAEALTRHFETPLAGRADELLLLRKAFERSVRERRCHLVTVFGAAGIGKTRLARELAASVAAEALVLTGRCLSYGEGITYWPLREIVGQATAGRPLGELLDGVSDSVAVAARLESAIGIGTGGALREEVFWAVRKLAETLARERPLVLVFEDIHWAEPTLLDLIEDLADSVRDVPVLVVCLARPELLDERPTWAGGKLNAASVLLDPLTAEESDELIAGLAAGSKLPPGTQARVAEAAAGNPLFLEQMLAMISESGNGGGEIAVPPAIQALLAARLERLEPDERLLLEHASIEGEVFHVGGVGALTQPGSEDALAPVLTSLVRKELIRSERAELPGEQAYRFRHGLIRDAAYHGLSKQARSELHERHADWLEQTHGDRVGEAEEILGYHLEQAYAYRSELGPTDTQALELADQAGRRLGSAGRKAFMRGDLPAGINLAERALSLLPVGSSIGLELMPDLAHALFEAGNHERGETVAREAVSRARAAGDRRLEYHAAVVGSLFRIYTRPGDIDLDHVRHEGEQALAVFDELDDALGRSRVQAVLFEVNWIAGRVESATRAAHAIALARQAGNRWNEIGGVGLFGWGMVCGPTPVQEARERCEELLLHVGRDRSVEALTAVWLAVFAGMEGRFDEAWELMARGREGLAEVGLRYWLGSAGLFEAQVAMLADDPALAEHRLREARRIFAESGNHWLESYAELELAHAMFAQGRHDDAFALTEAFMAAPARIDRYWEIRRRAIRAKVLAVRGVLDEALELAREAVALAAQIDLLNVRGETLLDFAELLRLAGRSDEAIPVVGEAVALFERKGNLVSAAKARAMLEELR